MNEAQLRDVLAERLELLEPGLTLVEKEHALQNPFGAKGFIDILARDRFGNRVIIELKRSDQAARQALHEIVKYVALFIGQHGLASDRVRCFVVSTEWRELLVPFAKFLEDTSFQAEGFRLEVKQGQIVCAERIAIPALPQPVSPFYNHGIFLFTNEEMRLSAFPRLQSALSECDATACVVLLLDFEGASPAVIYQYAVYVVPLQIESETWARLCQLVEQECAKDDSSPGNTDLLVEEHFHFRLNEKVSDFHDLFGTDYTYEIGYPEKFSSMREAGWIARQVHRIGSLGEAAADEDEVLRLVAGVEGQSDIRLYRTTSPRVAMAWQNLKSDTAKCFLGNSEWQSGYDQFCEWIETDWCDAVVSIAIYNPMNLLVSLYKLVAHGDPRFIPSMELIAFEEKEKRIRFMLGGLGWDGQTMPVAVGDVFDLLNGDLEEFVFRGGMGAAWEWDAEIMLAHGISYCLYQGESLAGETLQDRILFDAESDERQAGSETKPLTTFLDAGESYLKKLLVALDSVQTGL